MVVKKFKQNWQEENGKKINIFPGLLLTFFPRYCKFEFEFKRFKKRQMQYKFKKGGIKQWANSPKAYFYVFL